MERIEIDVRTGKRTVIGLSQEEIATIASRVISADELNAPIHAKIAEVEASTQRQVRDIVAGEGDVASGPDNKTPRQRLIEKRDRMATLRAQLK